MSIWRCLKFNSKRSRWVAKSGSSMIAEWFFTFSKSIFLPLLWWRSATTSDSSWTDIGRRRDTPVRPAVSRRTGHRSGICLTSGRREDRSTANPSDTPDRAGRKARKRQTAIIQHWSLFRQICRHVWKNDVAFLEENVAPRFAANVQISCAKCEKIWNKRQICALI